MKRREFITLLGGAAAWPLTARAQQPERMRRIGVLMNLAADDAEGQARLTAFLQGLQQLGWIDGRNVRIDTRWTAGDADYSQIRGGTTRARAGRCHGFYQRRSAALAPGDQRNFRSCSRSSLIRSAPANIELVAPGSDGLLALNVEPAWLTPMIAAERARGPSTEARPSDDPLAARAGMNSSRARDDATLIPNLGDDCPGVCLFPSQDFSSGRSLA